MHTFMHKETDTAHTYPSLSIGSMHWNLILLLFWKQRMQGFAIATPRTSPFLLLGQVSSAPGGGHQNDVRFAKQLGYVAVNVAVGIFSLPKISVLDILQLTAVQLHMYKCHCH